MKTIKLKLSDEVIEALDKIGDITDADAGLVLSRALGYYKTLSEFMSQNKRGKILLLDGRRQLEFKMEEFK
jgi:predicted transcriptional regulator